MAIKYKYQSTCCNTEYIETRNETDPMIYSTCVQCGQGQYDLIMETKLENVQQGPVGLTETPPIEMLNGAEGPQE